MAYEIIFTCHSKKQDGKGYDLENTESFVKRLGNVTDDIPLEELASMILKQMARRDKLITDVEIFEFTKKKITFKETDGGVLLKNKKFVLDENSLISTNTEETPAQFENNTNTEQTTPPQISVPSRCEIFSPNPNDIAIIQKRGFKLTVGKKYAIIKEVTHLAKVVINGTPEEIPAIDYEIKDDSGNKIKVPSILFVPETKGLIGQELLNQVESNRRGGGNLLYQGNDTLQMPVIRRNY